MKYEVEIRQEIYETKIIEVNHNDDYDNIKEALSKMHKLYKDEKVLVDPMEYNADKPMVSILNKIGEE